MAKQYKMTITVTVEEDLKEYVLAKGDIPGMLPQDTPADQFLVDGVSSAAWDLCDNASINIKHMHYNIEEVDDNTITTTKGS
jgi:hypothetical protein